MNDLQGDLLVVRGINKVASMIKVSVKESKAGLLVHGAETIFRPLVSDAHSTKLEWGEMNTCGGRQLAVAPQATARFLERRPEFVVRHSARWPVTTVQEGRDGWFKMSER